MEKFWFSYLFLLALINKASLEKISFAIVMDTTGSMDEEWEEVKKVTLNIVSTLSQFPIDNLIFVPFNDPGFGPASESLQLNTFRRQLNEISPDNGFGDCVEMCYSGIKLALEKSLRSSSIYVFTDAPPKDKYLLNDVLTIIQEKSIQVSFIITEGCIERDFSDYTIISSRSGGHTIYLPESDMNQISSYMKFKLHKADETINIITNTRPAGNSQFDISADSTMEEISVSVSGKNPQIIIRTPSNDIPKNMSTIVSLPEFKAVQVNNPDQSSYKVHLSSDSEHSIKISGQSNVNFEYGFFEDNIGDLTNIPPSGKEISILIKITDDLDKIKRLTTLRVTNIAGTVLSDISLRNADEFDSKHIFTSSNKYVFSEEYVYISIIGFDIYGNNFKRTSPTAIKPNPIVSKATSTKFRIKPSIIDWTENYDLEIGKRHSINCNAQGIPKPTVTWTLPNREIVKNKNDLILLNIQKSDEGVYKCKACNEVGSVEYTTTITTHIKPYIKNKDDFRKRSIKITKSIELVCQYGGTGKLDAAWYHSSEEIKNETEHIHRRDSNNKSILRISNAELGNGGTYTCKIKSIYGEAEESMVLKVRLGVYH